MGHPAFGSTQTSGVSQSAWASSTSVVMPLSRGTRGESHLRPGQDLDPAVHRRIEQQAYRCGSEFLFPREMFVQDTLSLETGISAIERLSHRYVASLEATA